MKTTGVCGILLLLTAILATGAQAQERKAYRYLDASGKITYSQTPPVDGKAAQKIDIQPAQRGRGGDVGGPYSKYEDPRYYASRGSYDPYAAAAARQRAYEARMAELRAQCLRQRGSDCDNPAALQYLDATTIPRSGAVVRPPRSLPHTPYRRSNG